MAENLISKDVVYAIVGNDAKASLVESLVNIVNGHGVKYGLSHPNALAMFVSQIAVESSRIRTIEENLNYSASGLLKTFGKYFTSAQAKQYANQPIKIANRAYANRMGNGSESSGDGWKYRGRGLKQLTGKSNYEAFSQWFWGDDRAVKNPDLLLQPNYSAWSAIWYWTKTSGIAAAAAKGDVTKVTKLINGGTNGLADRKKYFNTALAVFKKKIWNVIWKGATVPANISLYAFLTRIYSHYKK